MLQGKFLWQASFRISLLIALGEKFLEVLMGEHREEEHFKADYV